MSTTPVSLLHELKQAPSEATWRRFVSLYSQPLFRLARRWGLPVEDSSDLVQEVFLTLAVELPRFEYRPGQSFTAWLTTVARNKCRDRLRRQHNRPAHVPLDATLEEPANPSAVDPELRQELVARALELIETELPAQTAQACRERWLKGRSSAEVARELGISENAVNLRTSRAAARLHQLLEGLFD
jgi:RNA polymerase sigma-70 factor (ECF subfamily)